MDPLSAAAARAAGSEAEEDDGPSTSSSDPLGAGTRAAPARTPGFSERAAAFRAELSADVIDLKRLRALAYGGVPDEKGLRAVVWKVGTCLAGGLWRAGQAVVAAANTRLDGAAARPLARLQLLLGYLPLERGQWGRVLARKRAEYAQFREVRGRGSCVWRELCVSLGRRVGRLRGAQPHRGCVEEDWFEKAPRPSRGLRSSPGSCRS